MGGGGVIREGKDYSTMAQNKPDKVERHSK